MFIREGTTMWVKKTRYRESFPVIVLGYDSWRELFEVLTSIDEQEVFSRTIKTENESYGEISIDEFDIDSIRLAAIEADAEVEHNDSAIIISYQSERYEIPL